MRQAFVMQLKPGCAAEYEKRHNEIFAVQKNRGEGGSQDLGENPIVQKWWAHMADLMETHEDNEPVSIPLVEVFHMD